MLIGKKSTSYPLGFQREIGNADYSSASSRFVLTLLCLWLLAPTSILGDEKQDRADKDKKITTSVSVHTFFAKFPSFKTPVEPLELFPASVSSTGLNKGLNKSQEAFTQKKNEADRLRKDVDHDAHAMLMAAVNVLRTEGSWYSRHLGDRKDAEGNFHRRTLTFYMTVLRLHYADKDQRAAAEEYYTKHYVQAFPALEPRERQKVLDLFETRLKALQKARETTFRAIETRRLQVYRDLLQHAKQTADNAEEQDARIPVEARASIESAKNILDYEWLIGETSTHALIYGQLIAAQEAAAFGEQFHPAVFKAVRDKPGFRPSDALPGSATTERLALVKLRARRAKLTEVNRGLSVEAAYRAKVSILLGTWKIMKDVAGKTQRIYQDGVVSQEKLKALDIYAQPGALLAVAYKFFGDSFSLLMSTPLKDFFLQASKDLLGTEWTTTDQDHFADYEKQMKPVVFRMQLFDRIAEQFDEGTCRAWIAYFVGDASGKATGGSPPNVSQGVLRSLLGDADFIGATQGGLPAIFAPLVDDPRELKALLVRAAQYQINADFQAGTRRLAASRGQSVKPEDFASVKKALDKALGPVHPGSGWREPYVQRHWIYQAIPILGGMKALTEIPKITKFYVELVRGRIQEETAYIEGLGSHIDTITKLIGGLEKCGWDYQKLHQTAPELFNAHVFLLARSSAYVSAWSRIKQAESERIKLWRAANTTVAETRDLTLKGQRLLANDHLVQGIDQATLAVHEAFLRLAYLGQTRDYAGAALQTKELPLLEARRQRALGEKPKKIDFRAIEQAFQREALREDLIAAYEELYHATLKEVVLKVGARMLRNTLFGVDGAIGSGAAQAAFSDNTGEQIWQAFNPWAGKLKGREIRGMIEGALWDSAASITAHYGAQAAPRFQKAEIENVVNTMIALTAEVRAEATQKILDGTREFFIPKREVEERHKRMAQVGGELARFREENIDPLKKKLNELPEDDHEGRMELYQQIRDLQQQLDMLSLRGQALAAAADLENSEEAYQRAEEEANQIAAAIAAATADAEATSQSRGVTSEADARVTSIANRQAAADFLKKLAYGLADADDLARLTRADDPLHLDQNLFRLGLHISFLRRAIQRAYVAAPDSAPVLQTVIRDLDTLRRQRLQTLVTEFVNTRAEGANIERVDHNGAGNDDPEYGGIGDDLSLFVQVRQGEDPKQITGALQQFLEEKGYALGTPTSLVTSVSVQAPESPTGSTTPIKRAQTPLWDASQPLKTQLPEGGQIRKLSDDALQKIQENQGFRKDHAAGMHEYAQRTKSFLIMRDGNPQSVKHFSDPDAVAKDMSCKAKTQKVGPDAGFVVNPYHEKQAAEWQKALDAAQASGDTQEYTRLYDAREKARKAWNDNNQKMKDKDGYIVDADGLVRKPVTVERNGVWVKEYRKIHGDYDINGIFYVGGDKTRRVSFGDGTEMSNLLSKGFRENLNWRISKNGKEFILHGGQDDWLHEGKTPDPPVTVFFPDGRPPLRLENAADMKKFYENAMRVQWEYVTNLALGALDSQVRMAGTIQVGSQAFRSRAVRTWFANHNSYRGGKLLGKSEPVWKNIPREHAAALILDMAHQLGFLTDPRYAKETIQKLPNDETRKERLGTALKRGDRLLRLVDAWIIGDTVGHTSYTERGKTKGKAYYKAIVEDAKKLCTTSNENWKPLMPADLANLEQLAKLVGKPDVWATPGMSLSHASELLEWMRNKSIDLVAASATLWKHNYETLATGQAGDTRQRSLEAIRDAVAIATENYQAVPLLMPPLAVKEGRISVMEVEAFRKALIEAMTVGIKERAAVVAAQQASRDALLRAGRGGILDEAARKAIGNQIAAGLSTNAPNKQWINQMEIGLWALHAEMLLSGG